MSHTITLAPAETDAIFARLRHAHADIAAAYPGAKECRQPVHTVYGGAHLFRADVSAKLGHAALAFMDEYLPDAASLVTALGIHESDAPTIYERIRAKLAREPVEDFRIDFEDGYGYRPDTEEDEDATRAAGEVARGAAAGTLPPFLGLRIKSLGGALHRRAARTLDIFLTELVRGVGAPGLPPALVVALPKVVAPAEVTALAELLSSLEARLGLREGTIKCELMIETPQAFFDRSGGFVLPRLVAAAQGRCVAAHLGAFDFTAALDITAAHQSIRHPACDLARQLMHIALAGTGVAVSDSVTAILPRPRHRASPGVSLSPAQRAENGVAVHAAARLHCDNVRHALINGIYRGWDLHPAQLPVRYAAIYSFFGESAAAAVARLRHFLAEAAQATAIGEVFDDAATAQGLLNFFRMGLACGAITEEELQGTGLSRDELATRSFAAIVERRRAAARPG